MYKRIDDVQEQEITGYSFVDEDGSEIYVSLDGGDDMFVDIGNSDMSEFSIYKKDIPKLIKALEAAYNHKEV